MAKQPQPKQAKPADDEADWGESLLKWAIAGVGALVISGLVYVASVAYQVAYKNDQLIAKVDAMQLENAANLKSIRSALVDIMVKLKMGADAIKGAIQTAGLPPLDASELAALKTHDDSFKDSLPLLQNMGPQWSLYRSEKGMKIDHSSLPTGFPFTLDFLFEDPREAAHDACMSLVAQTIINYGGGKGRSVELIVADLYSNQRNHAGAARVLARALRKEPRNEEIARMLRKARSELEEVELTYTPDDDRMPAPRPQ